MEATSSACIWAEGRKGGGQKQDALDTNGCPPSPRSDITEKWDAQLRPPEEQLQLSLLPLRDMVLKKREEDFPPCVQGIGFSHPLH